MNIGDISYRVKVPILLTGVILLTVTAVAFALSWRAYEDLRVEMFRNAVEIGSVLSNSLPDAMLRDDLWSAYRMVRAAEGWADEASNRLLIVLDMNGLIYVSNKPRELSATTPLRTHGAEFARIESTLLSLSGELKPRSYEHDGDVNIYVILPMLSDGVAVGNIVIGYDKKLFWPRLIDIIERVVISAFIVAIVLLPFGWFLGNRIVSPLSKLNQCMSKIGRVKPEEIVCDLELGDDEIGQLGESFKRMLGELDEKEKMEVNMLASERLAAIGRLTAGVAHEINNPLGGMLNALNTFRKYSNTDELGHDTFKLIERGLEQIRDTVSALLVEANPRSHDLMPADIEDVHTLLLPVLRENDVSLVLINELKESVNLPSTPIRQILMNLALNAIQASHKDKEVQCMVTSTNNTLRLIVENEGPEIPREKMLHLFEPFLQDATGNGLGLWVTYQLVLQLDGIIEVKSVAGKTKFDVSFTTRKMA